MTTRDIVQYLDDPVLRYPGIKSEKYPDGHTYVVPWPTRKRGLRMTVLANLGRRAAAGEELTADERAQLQVEDDQEGDFAVMVLGAAVTDAMADDDVSDQTVQAIARDAYYCFTSSEALADLVLQGEAAARGSPGDREAEDRARREAAGGVEIRPGVWGYKGPNPPAGGGYAIIDITPKARGEKVGLSWADVLAEWNPIASDLLEIYRINVWDLEYMAGGSWLELRSQIRALLERPWAHDAFGKPVFTSMLQARVLANVKPPD